MSEFVRQEHIRLELGPEQRAFAVRQNDLEQLTVAMRAASGLWGGLRFPIVAVNDEGQPSEPGSGIELLDILGVTRVIDFTGALAPAGSVRTVARQVPVSPAPPPEDPWNWSPLSLVSYTLEDLDGKRVVEAAADDAFETAALGRLARREEASYWTEFGAIVEQATTTTFVQAQLDRLGLVEASLNGLRTMRADGPFADSMALVYVVADTVNFDDLHWFWNARAMRPGEGGLNLLVHLDELIANGDRLIEQVRRTARCTPSVGVVSLALTTADLEPALRDIGIPLHESDTWTDNPFSSGDLLEPTAVINKNPLSGWNGNREVGAVTDVTTALYRPSTRVGFVGPLPFAAPFTGQPVDLRLRSRVFEVPRRPSVATLFHRDASWAGSALRLRNRLLRGYELELHLPQPEEVLRAAAALPYTPSDKARQLRAVLNRETGQLALYRDPVVVALVEALTPPDSREVKRILESGEADDEVVRALRKLLRPDARTMNDIKSSLKAPAEKPPFARVASALGHLVDRGHVQRGLRADCTLCDTRDLRQLDEAPPAPMCRACGSPALYATGARGEPEMLYRLAPIMRIISANGGLPVLAAAAVLEAEGVHLLLGAELTDTDEKGEVDILAWGGTDLLAGEVKRTASGFTDVEADVGKSARFGADVHIAATLTHVSNDLRVDLESACQAVGLRLRMLDSGTLLLPG